VLLAHGLVDLVVEVADLVVGQAGFLDLRHLARDLLEHLAAPLLARRDQRHLGDDLGPARAAGVDDAEVGRLLGPEAEEHRLRFFGVARLVEGGWGVSRLVRRG